MKEHIKQIYNINNPGKIFIKKYLDLIIYLLVFPFYNFFNYVNNLIFKTCT